MKTPCIKCPECGRSDSLGLVERVYGIAPLHQSEEGSLCYAGETEINWDSQETLTNEAGHLRFACRECCHEWYQAAPEGGIQ